jgi:topoisomerase-4 subunit A
VCYVKRFAVGGITRDKEYDLTQGKAGTKVLYFTANKNGEAEKVKVSLKPKPKLKKTMFEFDFSVLAIKGRGSIGNILSKNPVKNIVLTQKGTSTLGALEVWFDKAVKRLNTESRGFKLGDFLAEDKIIAYYQDGYYKISALDISTHFDEGLLWVEKYNPHKPITAIYKDGIKKKYFIKRALPEMSTKRVDFLDNEQKQDLKLLSINYLPQIEVEYTEKGKKEKLKTHLNTAETVEIMRIKSRGKALSFENITALTELEPLPYEETIPEDIEIEMDISIDYEEDNGHSPLNSTTENSEDLEEDDEDDEKGSGVQIRLFD